MALIEKTIAWFAKLVLSIMREMVSSSSGLFLPYLLAGELMMLAAGLILRIMVTSYQA